METVKEIGVNKPPYINTKGQQNKAENRSSEQNAEAKQEKLLELLGPAVTVRYSDLLKSVLNNNQRIESFLDNVEEKKQSLDLYV